MNDLVNIYFVMMRIHCMTWMRQFRNVHQLFGAYRTTKIDWHGYAYMVQGIKINLIYDALVLYNARIYHHQDLQSFSGSTILMHGAHGTGIVILPCVWTLQALKGSHTGQNDNAPEVQGLDLYIIQMHCANANNIAICHVSEDFRCWICTSSLVSQQMA